jgi:hypothetical protein
MALNSGTWGYARWDGSLWGFKQSGVSVGAAITNQAMINFLAQTIPELMKITVTCTLGGVDITANIVSFKIESGVDRRTSTCDLVYAGSSIPNLVLNTSEIVLTLTYRGYSGNIFKGVASKVLPQIGLANQTIQVTCFDNSLGLDTLPLSASWTGTSSSLVAYEAGAANILMLDFDFEDITLTSQTINSQTKRILIKDLAGAIEEVVVVNQPDGSLTIRNVDTQIPSGWVYPLTNQLSQGVSESSTERYNKYTVTGSTGLTNSYTNTADAGIYGLLEGFYDSPWPLTAAQCLLKATSMVEWAIKPQITFQTIINPWLRAGTVCSVYIKDYSALKSVLIENISSSGAWDGSQGFWSSITGRIL